MRIQYIEITFTLIWLVHAPLSYVWEKSKYINNGGHANVWMHWQETPSCWTRSVKERRFVRHCPNCQVNNRYFENCNPKVAGSSPLWAAVFLSIIFACWNTSSQVNTHYQNDWSVSNQIEYTGLRQDSYLSLFVGCFYREGPALTNLFIFYLATAS